MSEYDRRQYRLMLDTLDQFEQGNIPLDMLVNNLEGVYWLSLRVCYPRGEMNF
jgi:hypothetical protein